jgi:hypothetical protein
MIKDKSGSHSIWIPCFLALLAENQIPKIKAKAKRKP